MRKFLSVGLLLSLALAVRVGAAGTALVNDPNILRATLKNGLRVVIVRNPLAPVATTVVNYRVGANETPAGFPGTAHALEHMMFRGNPGLSSDQLSEISALMGGSFDADTQQTITQYYFTVPAEDLEPALRIEALRMGGILCSEELWDKERGAIEQEVADDLSNPEYVLYTKLLEGLFHGTPYAHDALGTRPSFDKTTAAMLRKFYDEWYVPNNAILVIVGDVDPAATLATVRRLFEPLRPRRLPSRPPIHFSSVKPEMLHMNSDLGYGLAVMTFRFPGSDSRDYAATQVLGDILASHRSDLYVLVPAGKALSVEFALDALPRAGIAYALGAFPKGGDGQKLLAEMQEVLRQYLRKGFPADLVESSKRHRIADAEFQKNSVEGLAIAWSQAVAVEGRRSPDDEVTAIQKVTLADVNRAARKYLVLSRTISAILTPEESGKAVSSSSFGGHESFASKPTGPVVLPDWASEQFRKTPEPRSAVHPEVLTLTNGIQLIVQPESVSGTITLKGSIRNNPALQAPLHEDGVDQVLDELFSYGSESLDRIAFQKALDDIGATEDAGTGFELNVLTNYFERGVELLADNLLHPALPETAFKTVQRQTVDTIAGTMQTPDYFAHRALVTSLFPTNDPSWREATTNTVDALTLARVRSFYQQVFRPDMTTIVVVGNITADRAKSAIERAFSSWSAAGPKPEIDPPSVPLNASGVSTVPDKSRVQDKVVLAELLGVTRTNADYYALQLGNMVLGGAFYATRLYRDLRKDSGLVYYVSSSFDIDKTRALYQAEFGCDPPNVSKARAILVRDLKAMQTEPVTAEELQRAKVQWLRAIPLAEASAGSIASRLLFYATHDLPLDEPIRAANICLGLSAEDVRAAYAKWLHLDDFVQITVGPEPQ